MPIGYNAHDDAACLIWTAVLTNLPHRTAAGGKLLKGSSTYGTS